MTEERATASPADDIFAAAKPELPPVYLDRSTLERYADCPFAGAMIESGVIQDESTVAASGSENHRIIADGIADHADGGSFLDYVRGEKSFARPDVQAEVVKSLGRSAWAINSFLRYKVAPCPEYPEGVRRSPSDVLVHQGGQGERSGQMAVELLPATETRGAIMVTSEVDLLVAGAGADQLDEVDFKRWKRFTAESIAKSFQFRLHAWLIFRHYPEAATLRVRVWNVPDNQTSPWVTFERRYSEDVEGLLLQTVEVRRRVLDILNRARGILEADAADLPETGAERALPAEMQKVAADESFDLCWPDPGKCTWCAACMVCPRALWPAVDLNSDPVRFAQDTQVLDTLLSQRKADLRAYVDKHGDVQGRGVAFGLHRPKPVRKASSASYQFYAPGDSGDTNGKGAANASTA